MHRPLVMYTVLHQAMARDEVLKGLVEQYTVASSSSERAELLDSLIYQWTGSSEVDPDSRDPSKIYGHVMDARQLVTLENLVGRGYTGTWCWGEQDPNPHGQAAPKLIAEYERFKDYVEAQLLSQSDYQDFYSQISTVYNAETELVEAEFSGFVTKLQEEAVNGKYRRGCRSFKCA